MGGGATTVSFGIGAGGGGGGVGGGGGLGAATIGLTGGAVLMIGGNILLTSFFG